MTNRDGDGGDVAIENQGAMSVQMQRGVLITFEGLGGSGKSTAARRVIEWLDGIGAPVVATREPGGTSLGTHLRSLLLDAALVPTAWTEAFLFEADRAETYARVILPALQAGQVVVADRNVYGTIAYQAFGRRLDLDLVDRMNRVATLGCWPDLAFVLDIDPELGLVRKRGQQALDRFDEEDIAYQRRVREGYLFAAKRDSEHATVIDATRSPDVVFDEVRQIVVHRLSATFPDIFDEDVSG